MHSEEFWIIFFGVRCDSIFIFFLSEISVCEFFFSFLAEISFGEL